MKIKKFLVLGLILAMIITACTADQDTSLEGTSWILSELNGQPVLSDPLATLSFNGGQLGGNNSCNHYGGSYTVEGDQLSIGQNLFQTLMACEDSIMQQETAYMQALPLTATYEIKDDTLRLLDANGAVLAVFTAQSQELAGTSWIVTGYNNGKQALVSPLLDTEISLFFDADGKVSGKVCNSFFGSYKTADGTITISEMGRTEMFCVNPEGIMDQEDQFLAALGSAATYRVDGNSLELRAAGDEIAVSLIKVP